MNSSGLKNQRKNNLLHQEILMEDLNLDLKAKGRSKRGEGPWAVSEGIPRVPHSSART
jgi:hypothetical protein